jgi:hypothetical protein
MFAPPLTLNLNGTICLITIDGKLLMQRVEQTINFGLRVELKNRHIGLWTST